MRIPKLLNQMIEAIAVTSLCSFVLATNTKDGNPIPIVQIPSNAPGNEGGPRSTVDIIHAYYDTDFSCVCANLSNAGTSVSVEITNVATNETFDYVIPGSGLSILPISGNAGYWTITFTLPDRSVYGGYFML